MSIINTIFLILHHIYNILTPIRLINSIVQVGPKVINDLKVETIAEVDIQSRCKLHLFSLF